MKKVLLCSICFSIVFISCKKEEPLQPIDPVEKKKEKKVETTDSTIYVGQKAIYDFTGNFGSGIQTINDGFEISVVDEIADGKYAVVSNLISFGMKDTLTMEVDDYGVYEWTDANTKKLVTPMEPELGSVFHYVNGSDTTFREVVALDLEVNAPAGNFNCTVIKEYYSNSSSYTMEYIDGGLIKFESFGSNPVAFVLTSRNF